MSVADNQTGDVAINQYYMYKQGTPPIKPEKLYLSNMSIP